MIIRSAQHNFEAELAVTLVDTTFDFLGFGCIAWADFYLNPRRLRGSDFLMRWSQGVWSENMLAEAVNATGAFHAIRYGPSGTAPSNDVRAFEEYFERLEKAGLGKIKRPDLLIFRVKDKDHAEECVRKLGGISELPFVSEETPDMQTLLRRAILAVECENSLWRARCMPDYSTPLTPQKRLHGQLGMKKTAVLPTVIIKEEDRKGLRKWQKKTGIPIHIWHAFYDQAFGISLTNADKLIRAGSIEPVEQIFQAPGGAVTQKVIYKIYYQHGYLLAEIVQEPDLVADSITDKNGHILPYVRFVGGKYQLTEQALTVLQQAGSR